MIFFYKKLKPQTTTGDRHSGNIRSTFDHLVSRPPIFFLITSYYHHFNRAIFDTDECEDFADKLDSRIHVHDREIEKLCSAHHTGFIESIRDLLELKGLANKIHVGYHNFSYFLRIS